MEIPTSRTDAAAGPVQHASTRKVGEDLVKYREARERRVIDYLADSLATRNSLEANVGSINSGLMLTALDLDEFIRQRFQLEPGDPERLRRAMPAIDALLRVTRQVDRFAQLQLRSAVARRVAESAECNHLAASSGTNGPDSTDIDALTSWQGLAAQATDEPSADRDDSAIR